MRLGIHELFHHVSSLISVLLDRSSSKKNEIIKVNALSFKTLLLEYEYICLSEKINTVSSDESFDLFPKTRNMSHIDTEGTHPLDVHVTLHVSTDSNEEDQNDRNSIFFAWITILVWIHENMIGLTCVRRQRESFFYLSSLTCVLFDHCLSKKAIEKPLPETTNGLLFKILSSFFKHKLSSSGLSM